MSQYINIYNIQLIAGGREPTITASFQFARTPHSSYKTDEVSSKENRWLKTTQKSYSSTILKEKNTSKDWTAWKAYGHSHLSKGGETFSLFQSLQSTEVIEVGEKVISLPPCYLCYKMSPFLSLLQSPVKSSSRLFFGEDELPS